MSGDLPNSETIFAQAIEIDAAEDRAAFLDRACGEDAQLRGEVEKLVGDHFRAGGFLDQPAVELVATMDQPISERPGTVIGPYKLLEQIGEGGFGVVFMAEQTAPVKRKVALKVIKPGMDTRQVIARFEAERQALALMDHPNIARVLDAGATETGRPFFVMELVKGIPITDYCDQSQLAPKQRLELFVAVCQAVQHAHQKGIIHRDIKPTNVLVTLHDDRPVVKVIDFGVAKATSGQLTDKTLFTGFAQMIGTPLYMSPEQAALSAIDVDTRSDIYSLGVLLYELLTGLTPFDKARLHQAAFDEIRRIIREEEPQRPSMRLSDLGRWQQVRYVVPDGTRRMATTSSLASIAALRHTEPRKLSQLLRGELDWIVMKALEKDRSRRYETANAFAADVLHYLNNEHVQACPPSAAYRFRKFARRNRVLITTASLVAAALVAGTVVSIWQAIRADTARRAAVEQRTIAQQAQAAATEQRKVAESERAEAERQRAQAEANFQRARQTVDEYFTLVSESRLLDVPGLQPLRKELLDKALQFYEKTAVERANDPATLADLAVTYLRVAQVNHTVGRNDDAIAAFAGAMDVVDRLRRDYPNAAEHYRRLAGFWKGYRPAQSKTDMPKNPQAALKTLQRAIATWQQLVDEDPTHAPFQSDLASLCGLTALLLGGVNERESLQYYERSRSLLEKLVVEEPHVPENRADLGRICEVVVGQLVRAGRPAEAEAAQIRSLSLREELVTEFPDSYQYRGDLASILCSRASSIAKREPEEAETMLQRAVDLSLALVREWPEVMIGYSLLNRAVGDWGKHVVASAKPDQQEQFETIMLDLEALAASVPQGAELPQILLTANRSILRAKAIDDRPTALRQAIARFEKLVTAHPDIWDYRYELACNHNLLGIVLRNAGQNDEVAFELQTAQELWQQAPLPSIALAKAQVEADPENVHRWHALGQALFDSGRWQDAIAAFDRCIQLGSSAWQWFFLAMAHWQIDHRDEALRWYHKSLDWMDEVQEEKLRDRQAQAAYLLGLPDPWERSRNAATLVQQGNVHEQRGETEKAQAVYAEAIDLYKTLTLDYPFVPTYSRKLVDLLAKTGRQHEIEEVHRQMIARLDELPDGVERRLFQGTLLRDLGDLDKAIADFSWVIDNDPKRADVLDLRGNCYLRKGDLAKAADDYSEACRLQPGNQWYWHELAYAHLVLGQHDKSVDYHTRAIELGDDDAGQRLRRGDSYRALGEFEKAEADYNRAIELNPAAWENWYSRGRLFAERGQQEKAQADFAKIAALCQDARSLNNVAWGLATSADFNLRNSNLAVQLAKKGIELDPKSTLLPNTLGVAYYRAGHWQDAIEWLTKSMAARNGGDSFDWFFLAMAHWQMGNKDEARKWHAQAIEWMDKNSPANEELKRFRAESAELLARDSKESEAPSK